MLDDDTDKQILFLFLGFMILTLPLYIFYYRTILIWIIAINYGWDTFSWIQLGGFIVLVFGVFVFNGVFSWVWHHACGHARNGNNGNESARNNNNESTPLLS